MKVNTSHAQHAANLARWSRARAVIAGEDEVKAAGETYLPKLDSQTTEEYNAYKKRACFFNATGRTQDGFLGLLFRRDPAIKPGKEPGKSSQEIAAFLADVDMLGTSIGTYCKAVATSVLSVGRCGTLVDWNSELVARGYLSRYEAEDIVNWNMKKVGGRSVLGLVVLRELVPQVDPTDKFLVADVEQYRVLNLEAVSPGVEQYVVEVWQNVGKAESDWQMVKRTVPLRNGKPLDRIPFVFHGPRNCLPEVDNLPLEHIIHVNLDHYRLDADYKHGLHFTALPTAWVSGFEKSQDLRIGSSTAWVAEQSGAVAGFLEFRGLGLSTFENAQNRDERLMALLGSRMLEDTKRVGGAVQR